MHDRIEPVIYQFKVVLRRISPMIWRRLLVRSDAVPSPIFTTFSTSVLGWTDSQLHRFHIYGKAITPPPVFARAVGQ
jgi:hypothetical protein